MKANNVHHLLNRIKEGTFDEVDIKALLIEIREDLEKDSVLKDIAHCVAHETRQRGFLFRLVLHNYIRFLFQYDEQKLIHLFYTEGISSELNEAFKQLIYQIKDEKIRKKVVNFFKTNLKGKPKASIPVAVPQNLLLKNLGIFLQYTSITPISSEIIVEELARFSATFEKNNFGERKQHYNWLIYRSSNELILCILSILHDCKFELAENNIVSFYLSMNEGHEAQIRKLENNTLKVCMSIHSTYISKAVFAVIISELRAFNYIDHFMVGFIDPLEYFQCIRNAKGALRLTWSKSISKNDISAHFSPFNITTNFEFLSNEFKKKVLTDDSSFLKKLITEDGVIFNEAVILFEEEDYTGSAHKLDLLKTSTINRADFLHLLINLKIMQNLNFEVELEEYNRINKSSKKDSFIKLKIAILNKLSTGNSSVLNLINDWGGKFEIYPALNLLKGVKDTELIDCAAKYVNTADGISLSLLGCLYLEAAEYSKAEVNLLKAYFLNSYDEFNCLNLAELNYFKGNQTRFQALFERAKVLNIKIVDYLDKNIKNELS